MHEQLKARVLAKSLQLIQVQLVQYISERPSCLLSLTALLTQ